MHIPPGARSNLRSVPGPIPALTASDPNFGNELKNAISRQTLKKVLSLVSLIFKMIKAPSNRATMTTEPVNQEEPGNELLDKLKKCENF